jgi:hypothetical protein
MEKVLNQLVEKLSKAFGGRLISVVLYGSGAAGDHDGKFSDLNILCLLEEVTPRELGASEAIFRWWRELGNPSPLLLSEAELAASADCFAIELQDIQRSRRLLHGRDVVGGVAVGRVFYRAQVEHDLRAKMLRLRQKASGMLSEADLLRRLLVDSVSTFCVLFRHALMLHGVEPPATKREVVARVRQEFGIDAAPLDKLLDIREGRAKPRDVEPVALLGSYLQAISGVIDAVDRLERPGESK